MVKSEIYREIGTLILHRPEKRNALNPEMVSAIKTQMRHFEKNDGIRIIRIKSEGNTFCSGADLEYLQTMQSYSLSQNLEDSDQLKELFYQVWNSSKITIAQIEGFAVAGGAGLSACCDFVFANTSSRFCFSVVRIGFVPAMVMTFLNKKIGPNKTRELLLTGKMITAEEAKTLHWVNQVYPDNLIEEKVIEFAEEITANCSPQAIHQTKEMINQLLPLSVESFLEEASKRNAHARMTKDCKKGLDAFVNKKQSKWNG